MLAHKAPCAASEPAKQREMGPERWHAKRFHNGEGQVRGKEERSRRAY